VIEHACRIVQNIAVQLAERNDGLEGVTERVIGCDEAGGEEGEGTPEGLPGVRTLKEN
jgi:hypothetical protein